MTVLDGLWKLKENGAPGLAWRASCRMGICGSCGMMINGRPRLACNTQVSELGSDIVQVAPLPNFPIVRDLVPELDSMFDSHAGLHAVHHSRRRDRSWTTRRASSAQSHDEMERYLQFSYCIKCGCCMAACPTCATDAVYCRTDAAGPGTSLQRRHPRRRLRRKRREVLSGEQRSVELPLRRRVLSRLPQGRRPGKGDPAPQALPGTRHFAAQGIDDSRYDR